jgi:hypothetical protein
MLSSKTSNIYLPFNGNLTDPFQHHMKKTNIYARAPKGSQGGRTTGSKSKTLTRSASASWRGTTTWNTYLDQAFASEHILQVQRRIGHGGRIKSQRNGIAKYRKGRSAIDIDGYALIKPRGSHSEISMVADCVRPRVLDAEAHGFLGVVQVHGRDHHG